jgi:bifunctional non-homologous end joining protein LigD
VDRLATYRAKRDFSVTAEPSGTEPPPEAGRRFVVQRHRASRLHYDVRFEMDGVLVSWAVPKGPTLDPAARHLAVHVEDHPLGYFDFEGVIPAGEYGGGDVIVWDWGTYELAKGGVEDGDLHLDLAGEKLHGRFVLVHRGRGERDWLLLKKKDDDAVPGWDPEDHPRSVKSGRTNDEVKAAPDATWTRDDDESPTWAPPTEEELAALDGLGATGGWRLGGRRVSLSGLDEPAVPGATTRDLVRYVAAIAPHLLTHLHDRALTEAPGRVPQWVTRRDGGVVVDQPATLAWLANRGTVELRPSLTPLGSDRPSWVVVDLDPGDEASFDDVLVAARLHRTALGHLGVSAAPVVDGHRGIQVWVPVAGRATLAETRAWAESLAGAVGATIPDLAGLIGLAAAPVAPFSPRRRDGAPVAVPIRWDELDDPDLAPDRWTVHTALDRVADVGDPLRPLIGLAQELPRF